MVIHGNWKWWMGKSWDIYEDRMGAEQASYSLMEYGWTLVDEWGHI